MKIARGVFVGFVYFIRPVDCLPDVVKIGRTTCPLRRLDELLQWSPIRIELVAVAPATSADEKHIHRLFPEERTHFEWFRVSERVEALLDHVAAHGELPDYACYQPIRRAA